jgi:hypothetical protein
MPADIMAVSPVLRGRDDEEVLTAEISSSSLASTVDQEVRAKGEPDRVVPREGYASGSS